MSYHKVLVILQTSVYTFGLVCHRFIPLVWYAIGLYLWSGMPSVYAFGLVCHRFIPLVWYAISLCLWSGMLLVYTFAFNALRIRHQFTFALDIGTITIIMKTVTKN